MAPARKFKELEARVGYRFKNRDLLKKALTHASVRQASSKRRDNERLEFLGDRVLGLAVAELLSEVYPGANEGELARLYNRLVRGGTCAEVARELDLGAVPGAERSGGRAAAAATRRRSWPMPARRCSAPSSSRPATTRRARSCARTGAARLEGSPAECRRRQVRRCRNGRRARASTCRLRGGRPPGPRPRAALHRRGAHQGPQARARRGRQQARRRAGRRHRAACARGRVEAWRDE